MNEMMLSRRKLLSQCSAWALAGGLVLASPVHAQGAKATAPGTPKLLIVGDSLSAEYGLKRGTGWVRLLEQRLSESRIDAQVINASISGDTTSGGRARLPALLKQHQPTHVVIELGGNDALRGLPLTLTETNISAMVEAAQATGAKVLVAGIQVPPNYGRRYSEELAQVYQSVTKRHGTALVPSILKGVADAPNAEALFQPDRIHPREQAQATLLDNVWPVLQPLLR